MRYEYKCNFFDANGNHHSAFATLTETENKGLGVIDLYIDDIIQVLRFQTMQYTYGLHHIVVVHIRERLGFLHNDYKSITNESYVEYDSCNNILHDYHDYL